MAGPGAPSGSPRARASLLPPRPSWGLDGKWSSRDRNRQRLHPLRPSAGPRAKPLCAAPEGHRGRAGGIHAASPGRAGQGSPEAASPLCRRPGGPAAAPGPGRRAGRVCAAVRSGRGRRDGGRALAPAPAVCFPQDGGDDPGEGRGRGRGRGPGRGSPRAPDRVSCLLSRELSATQCPLPASRLSEGLRAVCTCCVPVHLGLPGRGGAGGIKASRSLLGPVLCAPAVCRSCPRVGGREGVGFPLETTGSPPAGAARAHLSPGLRALGSQEAGSGLGMGWVGKFQELAGTETSTRHPPAACGLRWSTHSTPSPLYRTEN